MLIGPKIPYFFHNNTDFFKKNGKLEASSNFFHFREDFLGKNFFDLPEMKLVRSYYSIRCSRWKYMGKPRRITGIIPKEYRRRFIQARA